MRLDEIVNVDDVLEARQYSSILRNLKTRAKSNIKMGLIRNKVIQSWKKGLKSRKHYQNLLAEVNIKLSDMTD